ncbi:hypothetical protein NDU88_005338 [Pleurodeles waltl]|uniref:Uncharacterized protein n=1 Tax=Pleurodeles waltl TaxID=8319 RepID=A0AAV7V4B6_PLEWA|nr:hypothetical protein NDU88_005338 [Pleurodeles waltl]
MAEASTPCESIVSSYITDIAAEAESKMAFRMSRNWLLFYCCCAQIKSRIGVRCWNAAHFNGALTGVWQQYFGALYAEVKSADEDVVVQRIETSI